MTNKEKLKLKIEEQRQLIRPKNTGEMKVVNTPTPLEQGWLNALKWMDELVDSLPEEPVEQDSELEEEIENWLLSGSITDTRYDDYCDEDIRDTARHFANWQREQMMKGAIDGLWIRRNRYTKKNVLSGIDLTHDVFQKFKDGDKLKIIVIKEEQL